MVTKTIVQFTLAVVALAAGPSVLVALDSAQATTPAERRQAWESHVRLRDSSEFRGMRWRALGPSLQGSRIEAIALSPRDPATMYVGPGAGNVWKTTNNGITWTPVFEHESAFSIGDISVAPSNADIVWVGTGEVQPRHSGPSFAGTGVFKSTDAGETWTHQGLDDTHHIGKVLIHPTDPDVVYVAAMGHFRSANDERGVFKSDDGGETWTRSLFVSDKTGVIDMVMDPSDPDTLFAWAWQLTVDSENGPESGLYKTTNAGATWRKVTTGLPAGPMGRAGLDIAVSQPQVMYAFVDNWTPMTTGQRNRTIVGGEVYRSDDRGDSWRKVNTADTYSVFGIFGWKFADVRVSPEDENELYILGNRMFRSTDGGRTFERIGETIRRVNNTPGEAIHLDHHELVIDPNNPARLVLGNDGGVFISHDSGATWLHLNNIPIGQFYFVTVDDEDPYRIYAGTQDTGALIGPSTYRYDADPVANDAWKYIWLDRWTGGDAFTTLPDPTDSRFVYYEHQNGAMRRMDMSMGNPYSGGPATEVVRPRVAEGESPVRFSWATPFLISHHDPRTLYAAANVVFKTTDRAATWRRMSPDLGEAGGTERSMVPTGSVTTLSESRLTAGVLYAGTEGGKVHVTRNDGGAWTNVSAGLPAKWVTRVLASEHAPAVAYVAQSGYRADDFRPYLSRSSDYGATWQSIATGLPSQPVNVVIEDPTSPSVLYVGTDLGVYVSLDSGQSWQSLVADLPSTPVYDLVVHRREGELIAATHGRSLFLMDVRAIQAMAAGVRATPLTVFPTRPVRLTWHVTREVPPQPPRGVAEIHYWLRSEGDVQMTIRDDQGRDVRTMTGSGLAGVNVIEWDTRNDAGRDARPGTYQIEVRANAAQATASVVLLPVAAR